MARLPQSVGSSPNSTGRLNGVVLLVEDEPSVRTVTRRMMEMRGLTVRMAETADEALQIAASCTGPIDVLLTDVQLPGMEGPELAGHLRAMRPDLKVVYISGYAREETFAHSRDDPSAEYLQKPFSPTQLAELLGRVLAQTRSMPP